MTMPVESQAVPCRLPGEGGQQAPRSGAPQRGAWGSSFMPPPGTQLHRSVLRQGKRSVQKLAAQPSISGCGGMTGSLREVASAAHNSDCVLSRSSLPAPQPGSHRGLCLVSALGCIPSQGAKSAVPPCPTPLAQSTQGTLASGQGNFPRLWPLQEQPPQLPALQTPRLQGRGWALGQRSLPPSMGLGHADEAELKYGPESPGPRRPGLSLKGAPLAPPVTGSFPCRPSGTCQATTHLGFSRAGGTDCGS